MKRCPECRRDYYDDSLMYCLDDGSALVDGAAREPATAILSGLGGFAEGKVGGEPQAQIDTTGPTAIYPSSIRDHPRRGLDKRVMMTLLALVVIALGGFYAYRTFTPTKPINSIAVLPFANDNGEKETEFLADGIAETLINNFTRITDLRVTARTTAFRYRGHEDEPINIGRELGVGSILTGRLFQRGDVLSVQVDLINASDGSQIWGDRYEGKSADIVNIQQRIASDVTSQLKLKLTGSQAQQIAKTYTINPEAYQFYLKGRFYWNKRGAENLKKAIEQFNAAAHRDPNYALAYVGLADCYVLLELYSGTPASDTLPKAKAYAERALAIDDSLPEAHVSLAYVHDQLWEWAEAESEFKRAIGINPNYPTAHHWYSLYLGDVGRTDEALAEIRRAQELDPVSSIIGQNLSILFLKSNDYRSAIENGRKMMEIDPNFANTNTYLGHAYLMQGNRSEAITDLERGVELSGRAALNLGDLGYGYGFTGNRVGAMAIIKELEEKYSRKESIGQYLAAVYAGLGQNDEAFAWLEKDFQVHSGQLAKIRWRPAFAAIRNDTRFADLLRRMGLPE